MKILRMREIAKRLGVCAGTVRNWERKGIIVFSRDTAGNRYCTEADWAELERRCADEKYLRGGGRD